MFKKPPFKMIIETKIEQWRYETWENKEPETIEWIKSFEPQNFFFDVGANIGIYSLYAASLYPQSIIFAFEPAKCNYIHLIQNIELNEFNNIMALPIGISDIDKMDFLSIKENVAGYSGSQIGNHGNYPIFCLKLDNFQDFSVPTYIKVDIDGQEYKVVKGTLNTLCNLMIKSCLIEINEDKEKIMSIFNNFGFTTDNRFNKLENHSRIRRAKEGIKAENVIFTRR